MTVVVKISIEIEQECGHPFTYTHTGLGKKDIEIPDILEKATWHAEQAMRLINHKCVYHAPTLDKSNIVEDGCDDCGL